MKIRLSELKKIIKEEVESAMSGAVDPAEIKAFANELERVDWFYEYADDYRVYTRGEAQVKEMKAKLASMAKSSPELLNSIIAYYEEKSSANPRVADYTTILNAIKRALGNK